MYVYEYAFAFLNTACSVRIMLLACMFSGLAIWQAQAPGVPALGKGHLSLPQFSLVFVWD